MMLKKTTLSLIIASIFFLAISIIPYVNPQRNGDLNGSFSAAFVGVLGLLTLSCAWILHILASAASSKPAYYSLYLLLALTILVITAISMDASNLATNTRMDRQIIRENNLENLLVMYASTHSEYLGPACYTNMYSLSDKDRILQSIASLTASASEKMRILDFFSKKESDFDNLHYIYYLEMIRSMGIPYVDLMCSKIKGKILGLLQQSNELSSVDARLLRALNSTLKTASNKADVEVFLKEAETCDKHNRLSLLTPRLIK